MWIELYDAQGDLIAQWFAKIDVDQAKEACRVLHSAVEEGLIARFDVGPSTPRHRKICQEFRLELDYSSLLRTLDGELKLMRRSRARMNRSSPGSR